MVAGGCSRLRLDEVVVDHMGRDHNEPDLGKEYLGTRGAQESDHTPPGAQRLRYR